MSLPISRARVQDFLCEEAHFLGRDVHYDGRHHHRSALAPGEQSLIPSGGVPLSLRELHRKLQ